MKGTLRDQSRGEGDGGFFGGGVSRAFQREWKDDQLSPTEYKWGILTAKRSKTHGTTAEVFLSFSGNRT